MGSVLKPYQPKRPGFSVRKRNYQDSRKTDRPRVIKHEENLQLELCDWIRTTLPGVHFRSDTASGAFSSKYEKDKHNRQQSNDSEPDLTILAARHGYHCMVIELKADGTELRMKRDGRVIRTIKDSSGKIIGRDYKIRKKGDWASLHIEKQALVLEDYRKNWHILGVFGVGLEVTKKMICRYFDIPYVENKQLF